MLPTKLRKAESPGPIDEDAHQVALFVWIGMNQGRIQDLRKVYAVPNGGHRSKAVAAKLKAQGVKAGALDLNLDVARRGYHGLRIELKRPANKLLGHRAGTLSEEQKERIADLTADGYLAVVCYGWEHARDTLVEYLS